MTRPVLRLEPVVVRRRRMRLAAEQGELVVRESRSGAPSRSISLPILRLPASSSPSERVPLFRLGGGPGLSNMRFVPPTAVGAVRDTVLVGYRGVDGSTRLDCPEITSALRHTGGAVLSPGARLRVAAASGAAAARLVGEGVDISAYSVAEVLADIDEARTVLGYDQIDLLSESYGTRVALLYAQLHPDHVRRSVLIGVNPPGRFVWDPAIVDAQLADWGQLWASSGDSERHADLRDTIATALGRLPPRWLGVRIDPGKAKIVTFVLLFQRRTGLVAIDAWEAAANGDPAGVAILSLAYDVAVPRSFTWGDFLAKAYSVDYDPDCDYTAWLDPPGAAFGSPLSLLFFGAKGGWPASPVPESLRSLRACSVPSLLVSGDLDVSTPLQTARDEALPYLDHGTQVIVPHASHVDDLWGLQPDAAQHLVSTFLDTGAVEASFEDAVPPLSPPVRLPVLAKAAGGTVATVLLAIGALATRALRR